MPPAAEYSTVQYYAVQCSYQEVGHGEEGGVHDPRSPGEDQDRPLGAGECEADHAGGVDQLAADVDGLGAEPGHHLVQEEGVAGAGEAVQTHPPAGEPHPLVIRPTGGAPLHGTRVAAKDGLTHEVREVEAVADQGAPAEEVGQTEPPEGAGHVDDGPEVLLQTGHGGGPVSLSPVLDWTRALGRPSSYYWPLITNYSHLPPG